MRPVTSSVSPNPLVIGVDVGGTKIAARAYELAVLQEMRAPGAQTLALTKLQLQNRMWITRYVFTPGARNRTILYSIYR
jgi:hypothetical protein